MGGYEETPIHDPRVDDIIKNIEVMKGLSEGIEIIAYVQIGGNSFSEGTIMDDLVRTRIKPILNVFNGIPTTFPVYIDEQTECSIILKIMNKSYTFDGTSFGYARLCNANNNIKHELKYRGVYIDDEDRSYILANGLVTFTESANYHIKPMYVYLKPRWR